MKSPVDLENLRSMIDGDPEMEKDLLNEFYKAFEQGIKDLNAHVSLDTQECWRKQAHALKGIAVNLGAQALGDLCKQGQEGYSASEEDKRNLLHLIRLEYSSVKNYLKHVS